VAGLVERLRALTWETHFEWGADRATALEKGLKDAADMLTRLSDTPRGEVGTLERDILALTKKHGNPNGTDYEQGVNDHGARILGLVRATPPNAGEDGPLFRHLQHIAEQKLPDEIHPDQLPGADWKEGFIFVVKAARFAVETWPRVPNAGEDDIIERCAALEAAARRFFKWFDITGSSVNSRWNRVPPEERAGIVADFRAALKTPPASGRQKP
jgi:hypothetical protein